MLIYYMSFSRCQERLRNVNGTFVRWRKIQKRPPCQTGGCLSTQRIWGIQDWGLAILTKGMLPSSGNGYGSSPQKKEVYGNPLFTASTIRIQMGAIVQVMSLLLCPYFGKILFLPSSLYSIIMFGLRRVMGKKPHF